LGLDTGVLDKARFIFDFVSSYLLLYPQRQFRNTLSLFSNIYIFMGLRNVFTLPLTEDRKAL
jgi:hypothetical protein